MRNLHRWIGTIAALFLISAATTGVILEYQRFVGGVLKLGSPPEGSPKARAAYTLETPLADYGSKLARAEELLRARQGKAGIDRIELVFRGDHPTFVFHLSGDDPQMVTVNAETGNVEKQGPEKRGSFLLRLHTGDVFGSMGALAGLLWGAALVVLAISGGILYFQIYSARAKKYGWKGVFWA